MEDITLGELLLSLLLTLILYGAFPLIFAGARKNSISGKKYGAWCWCVNFVLGTVCAVAVGSSTAGGYFLWTFVFWTLGKKNLAKKGLLLQMMNRMERLRLKKMSLRSAILMMTM